MQIAKIIITSNLRMSLSMKKNYLGTVLLKTRVNMVERRL